MNKVISNDIKFILLIYLEFSVLQCHNQYKALVNQIYNVPLVYVKSMSQVHNSQEFVSLSWGPSLDTFWK